MCKNLCFVIYKRNIIQPEQLLNIHHYNSSQEMDSIAAMREYVLKWTNELFAGWGDTPTSKQLTIILVHTYTLEFHIVVTLTNSIASDMKNVVKINDWPYYWLGKTHNQNNWQ